MTDTNFQSNNEVIRSVGRPNIDHSRSSVVSETPEIYLEEKVVFADVRLISDLRDTEAREGRVLFGFIASVLLISGALSWLVTAGAITNIRGVGFVWGALALFAVPAVFAIQALGLTVVDLGLTKKNLGRTLLDAALFCAAATPFVLLVMGQFREVYPADRAGPEIGAVLLIRYFFHAAIQEVFARGLLQHQLQKVLGSQFKLHALVLSSAVFAATHLMLGWQTATIVFLVSLVLGYLFQRQQNLAGAILVHFWIGLIGIYYGVI